METLELREYEEYSWRAPLDSAQLRALKDAHIGVAPSPDENGGYILTPSSYVGAVNVGDLVVVVRPKVSMDRVMFLLTYAMDPKHWRRESFELERAADVLEAIAFAFAHRTRQAIHRGLLQGYRREEDALTTVRGTHPLRRPGRTALRYRPVTHRGRLRRIHRGHRGEPAAQDRDSPAGVHVHSLRGRQTGGPPPPARLHHRRARLVPAGRGARSPLHPAQQALPPGGGARAPDHRQLEPGAVPRRGRRRRLPHRHEQGVRAVPLCCAERGA